MSTATSAQAATKSERWRSRTWGAAVWYSRIVGLLCLFSSLIPAFGHWLDGIPDNVYLAIWFLVGVPSVVLGLVMLTVSVGLRRRKRAAWWALLVFVFLLGPVGYYLTDLVTFGPSQVGWPTDYPAVYLVPTIIGLIMLGLVLWIRAECYAKGDPANRKLALGVLVGAFALSAMLGTTLVAATDSNKASSLADHLVYTLQEQLADTGLWPENTPVNVPIVVNNVINILGGCVFLIALYVLLRTTRHVALMTSDDESGVRKLLDQYGAEDSLGYYALRRDKAIMWSPTRKAAIGYRVVGGVSLAAGDPIGDVEAWPGAIDAWLAQAREHAWVPAAAGTSETGGTVYARHGLDALELGDEAIVEVPDFTLEGRAMRVVRQACNRIERAGYSTLIRRHDEIPEEEMTELARLAELWRGNAPERGFSMALGRLGDPADGQCVMVECRDCEGRIRALVSFVPWGPGGLSLDLMRRDRETDNGLIEYMVIQLIEKAKEVDIERLSLNFAMFRSVFERGSRLGAGPFLRLWRSVLLFFSRWWQIESLYRANAKYRPIWEPRYICFAAARDLPRIGLAYARAEGFLEMPKPQWTRGKAR